MSKVLSVFLFSILFFVSCGKQESESAPTSAPEVSAAVDASAEAGMASSSTSSIVDVATTGSGTDVSKLKWSLFNEGLLKAKKEGKHVILDFYADWCGYCNLMDENVYGDPEVAEAIGANFVAIKVNVEDNETELTYKGEKVTPRMLSREFKVSGLPLTFFLTPGGNPIAGQPGYIEKPQYLKMLDYIKSGAYKEKAEGGSQKK